MYLHCISYNDINSLIDLEHKSVCKKNAQITYISNDKFVKFCLRVLFDPTTLKIFPSKELAHFFPGWPEFCPGWTIEVFGKLDLVAEGHIHAPWSWLVTATTLQERIMVEINNQFLTTADSRRSLYVGLSSRVQKSIAKVS